MAKIDKRIVEMRFDNKQFERGVAESTVSLDTLKKALEFTGQENGLSKLASASKNFSLDGMGASIDNISKRFTTMGIIGMTAIQEITRSSIQFASRSAKALGSMILTGGKQRALNIEQAKFQFEGLGMSVKSAMDDALYAVKGTAYGLDEAAKVAGQLGASGVQLGTDMKTSLRAVSGVAAMTGSSYDQIGQIFTTVSGNGRLMGQQLLQLGSHGLNAAAVLAKSMGISEQAVRDLVSSGSIDFQTFANAMDEAFGAHATRANETYAGSLSNLKAAFSRLGAAVWTPKLTNMRDIFNSVTPVVDGLFTAMEPLIQSFKLAGDHFTRHLVRKIDKLDPRPLAVFAEAVGNTFSGLISAVKPVGEAFKEIFPAKPNAMLRFAVGVRDLTENFKLNWEQSDKVKRSFKGIFAVADLVGRAFVGVAKAVAPLASSAGNLLLTVAANIGDLLVGFRDIVVESGLVKAAFDLFSNATKLLGTAFSGVSTALDGTFKGFFKFLVEGLTKAATAIGNFLGGLDFSNVAGLFNAGVFGAIALGLRSFMEKLKDILPKGGAGGIVSDIKEVIGGVTESFASLQSTLRAKALMSIAGAIAILTGAIVVLASIDVGQLAKALGAISVLFLNMFTSLVIFEKVMDGKGLQGMIRVAGAMILLATAALLLSFAVKRLSSLSWGELAKGLVGVAGIMLILIGAAKGMENASKGMIRSSAGLVLFAAAMLILSSAVKKLGEIDTGSMIQGLIGVGVLLLELSLFMKFTNFSGMGVLAGAGLLLLATSMVVFSEAMKKIAAIDTGGLVQAVVAMGALLAIISVFTSFTAGGAALMGTGAGLVIFASGLTILTGVLTKLGGMSLAEIGKALLVLSGSLLVLSVAMIAMTGGIAGAAALVIMAGALAVLAPVLMLLGTMSLKSIGMALLALAGTFTVLGLSSLVLTPMIPVILALAAALVLLGAGVTLIGGGLALLAAGFTALSVAGLAGVQILTSAIVELLKLAPQIAVALVEGIVAFLVALADAGSQLIVAVGQILSDILTVIGEAIPQIVTIVVDFIGQMLDAVVTLAPKFKDAGVAMVMALLEGIRDNIGEVVSIAGDIIVDFLGALETEIPRVMDAGADLAIAVIDGMADTLESKGPEVAASMENLILVALELAIATIGSMIPGFGTAMDLLMGALDNGVTRGTPKVVNNVKRVPTQSIAAIQPYGGQFNTEGGRWMSELKYGVDAGAGPVKGAAEGAASGAVSGANSKTGEFTGIGSNMMGGLIGGIRSRVMEVRDAAVQAVRTAVAAARAESREGSPSRVFMEIGGHMSEGMAIGITNFGPMAKKAAEGVARNTIEASKRVLGIHSPSTVFRDEVGKQIGAGMAAGITDSESTITHAVDTVSSKSYEAMKKWIDHRKRYFHISMGKELQQWEMIQSKYKEGSEERLEIDLAIKNLQRDIKKKAYEDTKKWMDEEKYYKRLTLESELATWLEIQSYYKAGTDERIQADREEYRLRNDIRTRDFNKAVAAIEEEKFYKRMSQEEELNAWLKIQKQYAEGTDERMKADREVFSQQERLIEQQQKLEEDNLKKQQDIRRQNMDEIKRMNEEYESALDSRTKAIADSYGLFDEVEQQWGDPLEGEVLLHHLEDQVKQLSDWEDALDTLADRGVDSDLLTEIASKGPQALEQVQALVRMSSRELTKYEDLWKSKNRMARGMAMEELKGMQRDTRSNIQALKAAADEEMNEVRVAFQTQAQATSHETNETFKIMNARVGATINALKEDTTTKFVELTTDVQKVITDINWSTMGLHMVEGINKGIEDNQHMIVSSMTRLARRALSAARRTLGIESPSKEFAEIGKFSVMGIAQGLSRYSKLATNAAKDLGRDTIDAFSNTISTIADAIDGDLDFNPTITPVVDLGNVHSSLAGAFNDIPIVSTLGLANSASRVTKIQQQEREHRAAQVDNSKVENKFTVHATIREEADIAKVSEGLYKLQTRAERGRGRTR